jgi:hypothetical protein
MARNQKSVEYNLVRFFCPHFHLHIIVSKMRVVSSKSHICPLFSGKVHQSLSSQLPNIRRHFSLKLMLACVSEWCLRLKNLVFEGKRAPVQSFLPTLRNLNTFDLFLSNFSLSMLLACFVFPIYNKALLTHLTSKLQIYGHYHWDRRPRSHQVAKVRLALPQGRSNLNQVKIMVVLLHFHCSGCYAKDSAWLTFKKN